MVDRPQDPDRRPNWRDYTRYAAFALLAFFIGFVVLVLVAALACVMAS